MARKIEMNARKNILEGAKEIIQSLKEQFTQIKSGFGLMFIGVIFPRLDLKKKRTSYDTERTTDSPSF